jgi:hypothetical protein
VCVYGDIDHSANSGKGVTPQQTEVNEVEPTGCSVDLGLSNGCKPEEKAAVEDAIAKRQSCEITLKYSYCNTKVAAEEATPEIEN